MSIRCVIRVLIVDNDLRTRDQLVRMLSLAGHRVQAAEGQGVELGRSARELAERFRPHVVVMDLRLADEHADDRSGLDLWREKSFSSARCILYSAYLVENYRISIEALRQDGVEDVVGKEDAPQKLLEAVERAARKGCSCERGLSLAWPSAWNEQAVIDCLFKDPADRPDDMVLDVVGRLFPQTRSVALKALEGTAKSSAAVGRGRALLFQAIPDDREPVVIKLAPREGIQVEARAYREHIQDRLVGRFYAELQSFTDFWDLGGICYSFIGSSLKSIETFSSFYCQARYASEILKPLEHFFEEVWRRHYSGTHSPLATTLFAAYNDFLKLDRQMEAFPIQGKIFSLAGLSGQYPNPAAWIRTHEADSYFPAAKQAVTHGDLHGDNLFVEKDHAWAIDFERAGMSHILRDFVELEDDIITRLLTIPDEDPAAFYQLAIALTRPLSPSEPVVIPGRFSNEEEVHKAVEVINGLRSIAHRITRCEDMHEYYWGLLLDAFFGLKLAEPYSPKWLRGLLLASLLCARLKNWGRAWPPEGWPAAEHGPPAGLLKVHEAGSDHRLQRRVPIPGAPNAEPLDYEYLRMLAREGQETYLARDGDRLVRVNVRELLESVDGVDRRHESAGTVTTYHIGSITIGDGARVGDIVLASEIQKSFNKAQSADIQKELKDTLKQLAEAVDALSRALPSEQAAEVAEDYARLVDEATKPAPGRKWYSVSIEGLIKAAENVERVGEPVIRLSRKVLALLTGGVVSS